MERHRCKLCHRRFSNGRALGGHMKAHFSTLPLPHNGEEEEEDKALGFYGLRENPKRSFRLAAIDGGSVVTDTESSKRRMKASPLSSVSSDASKDEDMDLAMCLMMLSRDKSDKIKIKSKSKSRHRCHKCNKAFRSQQAMLSHTSICFGEDETESLLSQRHRVFRCPYCCKVFGSGQALGGHKRSHQLNPNAASTCVNNRGDCFIDLNLPAPLEDDDDDFSVLSDA